MNSAKLCHRLLISWICLGSVFKAIQTKPKAWLLLHPRVPITCQGHPPVPWVSPGLLGHQRFWGTPWLILCSFSLMLPPPSPGTLKAGHRCVLSCFSHVWLFATLWTIAHEFPLSMGFSRRECWSGLPFPPPGDLPDPGMEPVSPASPTSTGKFFTTKPPGKHQW